MSAQSEACALDEHGQLLPASAIAFFNSPSDNSPLPRAAPDSPSPAPKTSVASSVLEKPAPVKGAETARRSGTRNAASGRLAKFNQAIKSMTAPDRNEDDTETQDDIPASSSAQSKPKNTTKPKEKKSALPGGSKKDTLNTNPQPAQVRKKASATKAVPPDSTEQGKDDDEIVEVPAPGASNAEKQTGSAEKVSVIYNTYPH